MVAWLELLLAEESLRDLPLRRSPSLRGGPVVGPAKSWSRMPLRNMESVSSCEVGPNAVGGPIGVANVVEEPTDPAVVISLVSCCSCLSTCMAPTSIGVVSCRTRPSFSQVGGRSSLTFVGAAMRRVAKDLFEVVRKVDDVSAMPTEPGTTAHIGRAHVRLAGR